MRPGILSSRRPALAASPARSVLPPRGGPGLRRRDPRDGRGGLPRRRGPHAPRPQRVDRGPEEIPAPPVPGRRRIHERGPLARRGHRAFLRVPRPHRGGGPLRGRRGPGRRRVFRRPSPREAPSRSPATSASLSTPPISRPSTWAARKNPFSGWARADIGASFPSAFIRSEP